MGLKCRCSPKLMIMFLGILTLVSVSYRLCLISVIARFKLERVRINILTYITSGRLRAVNSTYLVSGEMHP